jgi:hypothetical protein
MFWIARVSFLLCLFLSALAIPATAVPLVLSTFDTGTDGWTGIIIDGSTILPSSASFVAGAGNPGGALRHDAPSDSATSFFLAPAAFVAGLHSAVGGSLSWDSSTISHAGDVFFASFADVNIRAGSDRLRLDVTPPAPATHPGFTHYDVGFNVATGWLLFDGTTTTTATQTQIDSMLAEAESLIIRAEYFSGPTADVGFLDNVALNATPEPGTLLLFGSTLAALTRRFLRRPTG